VGRRGGGGRHGGGGNRDEGGGGARVVRAVAHGGGGIVTAPDDRLVSAVALGSASLSMLGLGGGGWRGFIDDNYRGDRGRGGEPTVGWR
jgi:hypothetical protein